MTEVRVHKVSIESPATQALLGVLNAEITEQYPEQGANFFQLDARAKSRGAVEVTVPTRRARSFYLALGFEATAEYFKRKLR